MASFAIMKVFLDDIRSTPAGWTRTYTVHETIELLKTGKVTHLSLDHDLGTKLDGHDVLVWIEEQVAINDFNPPEEIFIHSANSVARQEMQAAINSIRRLADDH